MLIAAVVVESSLWLKPVWHFRNAIARILMIANIVLFIAAGITHPAIWNAVLLYLGLYRSVNMLRIIRNRLPSDYLYHATWRTSQVLILLQLIVVFLAYFTHYVNIPNHALLYVSGCLILLLNLLLLLHLHRQLRVTMPKMLTQDGESDHMPSVSVLIPARNETVELQECLEALLRSSYRKLEIIVLDDCSQNNRTSEIIKSFAHDGVRFIPGNIPPKHWLAKNHAYNRLVEESNGEILLFCGVDTRFAPETVSQLVSELQSRKKNMLSVLPINILPQQSSILSSAVQATRYAWEFMLPRQYIGRPAVLSTCWLITRKQLKNSGGFNAYKQSIVPERYFAKAAAATNDSYSFLQSPKTGSVTTNKTFVDQKDTAVRTRYPLLRKRPENVVMFCIANTLLSIFPFALLITALLTGDRTLLAVSSASCASLMIMGLMMTKLLYRRLLWRGILLFPMQTIIDIILLNISLHRYEFSEVLWKGRNICVPVMEVIPRLPKLD